MGEGNSNRGISFTEFPTHVSIKHGLLISYDITFRVFKAVKFNLFKNWGIMDIEHVSFSFLKKKTSLRCNSHTIRFTYLKRTAKCLLINSQGCLNVSMIYFRTSSSLQKETLYPCPHFLPTQQLYGTTILLSISVTLAILGISYEYIWSFVTGIFHFTYSFQSSSMFYYISTFVL